MHTIMSLFYHYLLYLYHFNHMYINIISDVVMDIVPCTCALLVLNCMTDHITLLQFICVKEIT